MYSFKRLIKKYSKVPAFVIEEKDGYTDYEQGGIYVPGTIEKVLIENGAIVPLSTQDLEYGEGGTYTKEDRKLYCYVNLVKGTKIEHKGLNYTIQGNLDYGDFDIGLCIYIIKRGGSSEVD